MPITKHTLDGIRTTEEAIKPPSRLMGVGEDGDDEDYVLTDSGEGPNRL